MLHLNFYNILILVGVIHGIIFSFILLFHPKLKSKTNFFLAFTTLALCGSNLQYLLLDVGIVPLELYKNDLVFIPFEFLMVAMFYFFVRSPAVLGQEIRARNSDSITTISTDSANSPIRQGGCVNPN
ncbi:MAG: hypothetical protein AB8B65_15295 [Kordia sp.]|uniref:hypothetical protein n=1 Tax=Kordia sp. TaxID=1965332 RepID=UPI00385E74EB